MGFSTKKAGKSAAANTAGLDSVAKKRSEAFTKSAGADAKSTSDSIRADSAAAAKKPAAAKTSSGQSFGSAFKAARGSGAKTFQWQGKSYTTDMASDAPKKAAAKPAASAPSKPAASKPSAPAPKPAAPAAAKPSAPAPAPSKFSFADSPAARAGRAGANTPGVLSRMVSGLGADVEASRARTKAIIAKQEQDKQARAAANAPVKLRYAGVGRPAYAKGGSIDGIARKGKTKGKKV